jgi:hypothetical protein
MLCSTVASTLQPSKDRNGLSLFLWFANAHLVRETLFLVVFRSFSFSIMAPTPPSRPIYDASRVGPPLRETAIGNVSLFTSGAWAHEDTPVLPDGSYCTKLEQQFAAPLFLRPALGHSTFSQDNWEAGEVLEKFEALQRDFCYSNAADNSVRSPEARYRWTAEHGNRIAGFLACVKVFQGVDNAQNPVFGDPIITVLQAPVVTMDGKPVVGESVWPNQLPLAPDKYPVPRDEFYPWAASVAPAWRVFSDRHLRRSRSDYLSEVVYDLDGLDSFGYGWHVTNRRGTTEQSGLLVDSLQGISPMVGEKYMGLNEPPASLSTGQRVQYVPKMLPLPDLHGIPASELFHPALGGEQLAGAIQELALGTDAAARSTLLWVKSAPSLLAWADAVKAQTPRFTIPVVARSSIRDALAPGEAAGNRVTAETLTPMTHLDWSLAWRGHVDCIRASRVTSDVRMFDVYLQRAFESLARRNLAEKPVGVQPASVNPAIPLLRPPRTKCWLESIRRFWSPQRRSPLSMYQ